MPKTDPRFDAYIDKAADFAQPVLRHIRALVHEECPEAEEAMKWSSPAFVYRGRLLCGVAAFKAHCTFGFWHKGMEAVLDQDGVREGGAMGSFGRITSLEDLPSDRKMRQYIRKAAALGDTEGPARPRPAGKPAAPVVVPPDLAAALRKNKAAAATFEKF